MRGPHAGQRPTVVLHEAKGVQIGDGNTQTNTFT
ncbi:RIP homotypic interaction motif-containing protein [Nonomuraea maheshkhaliensis]